MPEIPVNTYEQNKRDALGINAMLQPTVETGRKLIETARISGLSVPTVARIYRVESENVHPRTAKALESALSGKGKSPLKRQRCLTIDEQERIVREIVKVLRRELARIL